MMSQSDTETEEMEYFAYSVTYEDSIYKINVAGGGMMNGNAYANVEFSFDNPNKIVYAEYGSNAYTNTNRDSILIFEKLDDDDYDYENFSIVKFDKATEEQRDTYDNFIDMLRDLYKFQAELRDEILNYKK